MQLSLDTFVLNLPVWLMILSGTVVSFAIAYVSIPTIIRVSHRIGLYAKENGRTSHKGEVPTLGGVAIFAGLIITGAIFANREVVAEYQYLLAAMVILFFTGVKDDLLIIDPKKKLVAQVLAAGLLVVLGDVRIASFHGFGNIHELPYLISVVFSIFVYIVIINGFNLIDGIDGLSSGVGIITSVTFGIWFLIQGEPNFAVVPFGLAGALIAFFRFNVFSKKNRIFLGDTGSLMIGLILAVVAMKFIEYPDLYVFKDNSSPSIAFGILIVPLFDTVRVFALRVLGGESPFKADRKHIHHRIIDLGCSHLCATIIILSVNVLFIALVFLLQNLGNLKIMVIILSLAAALSYIPVYLIYRRNMSVKKQEEDKKVIPLSNSHVKGHISEVG